MKRITRTLSLIPCLLVLLASPALATIIVTIGDDVVAAPDRPETHDSRFVGDERETTGVFAVDGARFLATMPHDISTTPIVVQHLSEAYPLAMSQLGQTLRGEDGIVLQRNEPRPSAPVFVSADVLRYPNVYAATDDEYTLADDRLKHDWVLREQPSFGPDAAWYGYHVRLGLPAGATLAGADPKTGVAYELSVALADGEVIYTLPAIVAVDAAGNSVEGRYVIESAAAGEALLFVEVASSWLLHASYPVRIDPTIVTVDSSDTSANTIPWNQTSAYTYQQTYSAGQMLNTAGDITRIGFRQQGAINRTWSTFRLYMGESNLVATTASTTFDLNFTVVPKTLVYNGSLTLNYAAGDYAMFSLQTPFAYSGQHTLVVQIEFEPPSGTSSATFRQLSGGPAECYRLYSGTSSSATSGSKGNGFFLHCRFEIMQGPDLKVDMVGPTTAEVVDSDSDGSTGDGEILGEFTIRSGDDWTVNSIEFTVAGTGDGSTAFTELGLYEDDGNATFDGSTTDLLATAVPGIAFSGPNGTYTATLIDPDFPQATNRRFFLVGKLAGTATAGQTFEVAITALNATTMSGGSIDGVPTAYSAGIEIDEAHLEVTAWGPFSQQPYPFDATGPHGDGILMMELTFEATNHDFEFDSIDIRSFGSGNSADHFGEIALYLDNGSGTWDGAAVDTLIDSATAFPTDNGTWSPSLTGHTFAQGTEVRLYFVAKLNGEAPNGLNFGVALDAISVVSPTNFQVTGVPMSGALTILIDTPLVVTSFDPLLGSRDGGESITLQGTGFRAPFFVRIDGVTAAGTAQINSNGTSVTGFTVPPGRGENLPIEVMSGSQTILLTETFTYEEIPVVVEVFTPMTSPEVGGGEIVIEGSGFRAPIALRIGEIEAEGSAEINGDGTEITGFIVPPGTGRDLEIVLTVEGVEHVLSQRFAYVVPGSNDSSGCGTFAASGDGSRLVGWLGLAVLLVALGLRRRLA